MTVTQALGLVLALGLPWLAGGAAVGRLAPRASGASVHRATVVGFGFLAGQLFVVGGLALAQALLGRWSIGPVVVPLLIIIALAWRPRGRAFASQGTARGAAVPMADNSLPRLRLLSACLIALCAVHLAFAAIEILHRPVFPWDGWLNWMYRAKAWYFAGGWTPFDSPTAWLQGQREVAHAVHGNHYPPLLPMTGVWIALCTGGWTETLINLPTLGCGVALSLCTYGLMRDARQPAWAAALAAYLLVSMPLVGAHLSLAGMADIWMAGFTGLGFTLVYLGGLRGQWQPVVTGVVLVGLSRLVKLEGTVWLLAALLAAALLLRPRLTLLLTAGALAAGAVLGVLGITAVTLPLLGEIGVVEGRLQVPLIGSFALADWQLLDDYRDNFLRGGSWHLLWPAILLALLMLLRCRAWPLAAATAAVLATQVLALIGVFQFTENGAWAEDWSAINRLPLHVTPFVAVALALAAVRLATAGPRRDSTPARPALRWLPAGTALIAALSVFFLVSEHQSRHEQGNARSFPAATLQTVLGETSRDANGALAYTGFQDGITVVTTGEVAIDADATSLVAVSSRGSNREALTLFWRTADQPTTLQHTFVEARGDVTLDLSDRPEWAGNIIEIGVTAFDDGGTLQLLSLSVMPNNGSGQRARALEDWAAPNSWSQRSVNWVDAGNAGTDISLPMILGAALGAAVLPALLATGPTSRRLLAASLPVALLGWGILDARWLVSRAAMASATVESFASVQAAALDVGNDSGVLAAAARLQRAIGDTAQGHAALPPVIAVATENRDEQFQRLRARYHLLPLASLDVPEPGAMGRAPIDHILLLKPAFRPPGEADDIAAQWLGALGSDTWRIRHNGADSVILSRR